MAAVQWPAFQPNLSRGLNPARPTPYSGGTAQVPGQNFGPSMPGPPSSVQSALQFLGTPGGSAITNLAGAGLTAFGAAQQAGASREQNAKQFAAKSLQDQYNADRSLALEKAGGVLSADPLGAAQSFAQKNALLNAILPNLRNTRSTPGDAGVASAMGGPRGGIMSAIPAEGFDPAMVSSMFGPETTMNSIAQRNKELLNLDSSAPQTDLKSMYGAQAEPVQRQIASWAQQLQSKQGAERAQFEQQLNSYIQQMAAQDKPGGFWHKFAKIAGVVGAGVATLMTAGGATPMLAAAIGAGSGAASGWGSGGGIKGALLGAGLGALPGVGGAAGKTAAPVALNASNIARSTLTNPALYGAIIGH